MAERNLYKLTAEDEAEIDNLARYAETVRILFAARDYLARKPSGDCGEITEAKARNWAVRDEAYKILRQHKPEWLDEPIRLHALIKHMLIQLTGSIYHGEPLFTGLSTKTLKPITPKLIEGGSKDA